MIKINLRHIFGCAKVMGETGGGTATDNFSPHIAISSPESAFLLVSTKNTESGHFQGRKSANHGLPARLRTIAHKLELATVRVLGVEKKGKRTLGTRSLALG